MARSRTAIRAGTLRRVMNLWPPFLFAGIRLVALSPDFRHARVELRAYWFNRNYVGTHFGGSLFAMTDPFWMLMAMQVLGDDYVVWDQAAEIVFARPGRGTVTAEFVFTDAHLETLRTGTADGAKVLHWFENDVRDGNGDVVARVRKQVYVRRKRDRATAPGA